ncbi:MAG: bifunctional protein tyrosine phosphatase family protein/NAD(P)/FAD-dependent oxidoreductase [Burkholderiaceae bacterium]|nr:bifunctional protein tyrosine phosphatase family protein/NAD(P)/FAD-dependent oxidoreductase [Burkholderiaceae bacterium]
MNANPINPSLAVTAQITAADVAEIAAAGFKTIICNRPDGEISDQTPFSAIKSAAETAGLSAHYLPTITGQVSDADGRAFGEIMASVPHPVLAYCRSGTRSATMWALSQAGQLPADAILAAVQGAGYDLSALKARFEAPKPAPAAKSPSIGAGSEGDHQIVIIGGGSAGIAVASSLLARDSGLDIAIIEPADRHCYQPGWTMVGAGVFRAESTVRPMAAVMPRGVVHINGAVTSFEPEHNQVTLESGKTVTYKQLIVCPGLKLDWEGIPGLVDALGHDGVTSNYRYDLAPYTWQLVQSMRGGTALFTQPPMPIKCAGAPQKAMYLSADHWRQQGVLKDIRIEFCNAGGVLFGVPEYVPALMAYVNAYGIQLNFTRNLVAINGTSKQATFKQTVADGTISEVVQDYDMIHVVPPQKAPDFVRASPLADASGWVEIDPASMQHKRYDNIHALGDVGNTTNAKTAAAARKQAPVVAHNVLSALGKRSGTVTYDGYGSCPLTVERGKIVLAEFTYGGKLAPSFPQWLINGTRPSRLAWFLKERVLPPLYWEAMLKGREWLAQPNS